MPDFIIIFVYLMPYYIFKKIQSSLTGKKPIAIALILVVILLPGCHGLREARKGPLTEAERAFYLAHSNKLGYTLSGDEDPRLIAEVSSWLGTPHRYAGTTRQGADCSGFVMGVFRAVYRINLPRSSTEQATSTRRIGKSQLRGGDLVFFRTSGGRRISHVGIYLSNNKFIHVSSSRGVMVSDLDEPYYSRTFAHAGRAR